MGVAVAELAGVTDVIRLRSRYIAARDADVPISVYLGEPPQLIPGCTVEDISWSWGASGDSGVLTTVDAGSGSFRLYDPGRIFDPTNTDALGNIGTVIRVTVAGVDAFRGRIDDIAHDLFTATIRVVDDVSALAAVQFVETNVPAETSSARVKRILDLAAWPADRRDIGPGGVALQAGTVAADAWSELVEVTRNELGALWLTPAGIVTWRARADAWAGGTPVMTFGCPPSDAYLIDIANRADQSALVNYLSAARRGGTQATVSDQQSLGLYGPHTHVQNDLELVADGDRDLWSDFYLRRQAYPARGVGGFTTRPGSSAIQKALALPFGAIVRVVDSGHGPDLDRPARWLGAHWNCQPGVIELVTTTGEDASIRMLDRSRSLDTPAQWQAANPFGTLINPGYAEPGLVPAKLWPTMWDALTDDVSWDDVDPAATWNTVWT